MFKQDQEIFNILLGAVSEGVIVVDAHKTIVEVNETAELLFGYNRENLIKQPLTILIPDEYKNCHGAHFEDFMKQQVRRQMGEGQCIVGKRKDGTIFPIEVGLSPFKIFGSNYVMALVTDISIRKAQEQKIHELNAFLEKRVEKRTKALEIAINKLKQLNIELAEENKKRRAAERDVKLALKREQELNELKTKFLSLVSHEFKTPLSGVLTSAMLLSKYKLTEQQEKRDKHIKNIQDKVHFLDALLDDFLSVEKLEKGQIKYTPNEFKLSKVVNEVVYNANMLLKDGQRINYPDNINDFSLYQDEKIIELCLFNIVHNAIKYSSENTVIDINIKQGDLTTSIKVKDNGIGIPKKDQENIFNRYFRAENALILQGNGIGLNIVKTHMINLGGTITFESKEHIGSTFTIKIPNRAEHENVIIN